jgi:hypothetical protein
MGKDLKRISSSIMNHECRPDTEESTHTFQVIACLEEPHQLSNGRSSSFGYHVHHRLLFSLRLSLGCSGGLLSHSAQRRSAVNRRVNRKVRCIGNADRRTLRVFGAPVVTAASDALPVTILTLNDHVFGASKPVPCAKTGILADNNRRRV